MDTKDIAIFEKLKQAVAVTDNKTQPFLYYLPFLLSKGNLSSIKPEQALRFVAVALKHDKPVIMKDALTVLNRLISSDDGSFLTPSKTLFIENQTFFWNNLGKNITVPDIILHVFNKTYFELLVGQHT